MHFLPVNLAGLFLIGLSLAFFILEAKAPSHGVLALGGVVSMFLGAIFLVRSPLTPGGVSVGVALAGTVPFAVLAVVLMRLVLRSRRLKTATGKEEMIGSQGVAIGPLAAGRGRNGGPCARRSGPRRCAEPTCAPRQPPPPTETTDDRTTPRRTHTCKPP